MASNVNQGRPGLAATAIDSGQAAALLFSSKYSGAFINVMSQTYGQPCTIAHSSPPYLLHDISASACLQRGSGSCAELTPGVPVRQHPATSLLTEFCLPSTRFKELPTPTMADFPCWHGVPLGAAPLAASVDSCLHLPAATLKMLMAVALQAVASNQLRPPVSLHCNG